ncbi:BrnT family toxin [Rhodopseudomonas sp. BR0C11]|uniref:BrnT family toxin n=1 Tax=Rhodopseudomonas sp. BR0C11 TaxID=2269370 RepID=UPI0013DE9790|nr:BrnT family toxin [Rhodopseudomonas sp. BR0C11]NEV75875.1 BrnT family toxin [Rhodopseudomonas sp. BR0C11]
MSDFDPAKDAINRAKHGISLARWVDLRVRSIIRDVSLRRAHDKEMRRHAP